MTWDPLGENSVDETLGAVVQLEQKKKCLIWCSESAEQSTSNASTNSAAVTTDISILSSETRDATDALTSDFPSSNANYTSTVATEILAAETRDAANAIVSAFASSKANYTSTVATEISRNTSDIVSVAADTCSSIPRKSEVVQHQSGLYLGLTVSIIVLFMVLLFSAFMYYFRKYKMLKRRKCSHLNLSNFPPYNVRHVYTQTTEQTRSLQASNMASTSNYFYSLIDLSTPVEPPTPVPIFQESTL